MRFEEDWEVDLMWNEVYYVGNEVSWTWGV